MNNYETKKSNSNNSTCMNDDIEKRRKNTITDKKGKKKKKKTSEINQLIKLSPPWLILLSTNDTLVNHFAALS